MDIQSQVSILFDADTAPLRHLQTRLKGLTRDLERSSGATDKQGNSLDKLGKRFSDQGLANIQAGLVQLSNYSLHLSQSINNVFEKAQNRYVSVDQALTQLRITMGLTGQRSLEFLSPQDSVLQEYRRIESTIKQLARTTQFTAKDMATLANTFRMAGKSIDDTITFTILAQRLSAASAGAVDLNTAGELILNTLNNSSQNADTLSRSLDRLVFASQNTQLSVSDMSEGYKSLSGALRGLKTDANELDAFLYTIMAGYKQMGKSPREATQALSQTIKAFSGLYNTLDREFSRAGGKTTEAALKKAYGRQNIKRNVLLEALGIGRDSKQVRDLAMREYGRVTDMTIEAARDRLAKAALGGEGGAKISGAKLVDIVRNARGNLAKLGDGAQSVEARLKAAFGTDALITFQRAIELIDEGGRELGLNFEGVMRRTAKAQGTLSSASEESLKSLASRLQLLESAEDALSNAIFKHDLVAQGAVDTYTELVGTAAELATKNSGLSKSIAAVGRAAQIASGFVTNLGFTLTAMATFSIGLRYAQIDLASRTTSLARIFGSFYSVFLGPTLAVMISLVGAVGLVGVAFVGYIRKMTGATSTAEGFKNILEAVTTRVKVLGAMVRLAFGGDDIEASKDDMLGYLKISQEASKLQAELAKQRLSLSTATSEEERRQITRKIKTTESSLHRLTEANQKVFKALGPGAIKAMRTASGGVLEETLSLGDKLVNAVRSISALVEGASAPLGAAFEFFVGTLKVMGNVFMAPIRILGNLIEVLFGVGDGTQAVMRFIGGAIGVFFGLKFVMSLTVGTVLGLIGVLDRLRQAMSPTGIVNYLTQLRLYRQDLTDAGVTTSRTKMVLDTLANSFKIYTLGLAEATAQLRAYNQEQARVATANLTQQQQVEVTQAQATANNVLSPIQGDLDVAQSDLDFAKRQQAQARKQSSIEVKQATLEVTTAKQGGSPSQISSAEARLHQARQSQLLFEVQTTEQVRLAEQNLHQTRQRHSTATRQSQQRQQQLQQQHQQQQESLQGREARAREEALRQMRVTEDAQGRLNTQTRRFGGISQGALVGAAMGFASLGPILQSLGFDMGQTFNTAMIVLSAIPSVIAIINTGFFAMAGAVIAAFWPVLAVIGALGAVYAAYSYFSTGTKKKSPAAGSAAASVPSATSVASATPRDMSSATTASINTRSMSVGPQQPVQEFRIENFHSNIKAETTADPKKFATMIQRELRNADFNNA